MKQDVNSKIINKIYSCRREAWLPSFVYQRLSVGMREQGENPYGEKVHLSTSGREFMPFIHALVREFEEEEENRESAVREWEV